MSDRQCSSCGGFCKKSGCERQNIMTTTTELIERLRLLSKSSGVPIVDRAAETIEAQAKQIEQWEVDFNEVLLERNLAMVRIEALQADVERYRWLRDEADSMSVDSPLCYMADLSGCAGDILYGEKLDAAIDAARKGNV